MSLPFAFSSSLLRLHITFNLILSLEKVWKFGAGAHERYIRGYCFKLSYGKIITVMLLHRFHVIVLKILWLQRRERREMIWRKGKIHYHFLSVKEGIFFGSIHEIHTFIITFCVLHTFFVVRKKKEHYLCENLLISREKGIVWVFF